MKLIEHEDYLVFLPELPCRVVSSAVLNGGISDTEALLNLRVDKDEPPPWLPPAQTLTEKAESLQLPFPVTGMMTAASMRSLTQVCKNRGDLKVHAWVTAGLSNTRRVGDVADEIPKAGTINIGVFINQPLSDTALVEALMILTEAKVTAIRDLEIVSPISGLPASGTGTDSHAVLCPKGAAIHHYCGKHTVLGEMIGAAVLEACLQSLTKCLTQQVNAKII
ncbi:adenosylcobinamide amidohydrolase [Vibrio porteresiae]|uniref:Adenosylcobinamide amidohydrolase n=1 Tax=Vibrio porteresiae DSM 19223 TaxID=1123496 RepID=A0ABZ0QHS2_9VIBR|nr:adenosylcobinamide amidohydrolase [Vibrio porteresiae]WPC76047.1 adenosylcobinamide amidohydrolase [Vibrio porteresiae DSM 19223]